MTASALQQKHGFAVTNKLFITIIYLSDWKTKKKLVANQNFPGRITEIVDGAYVEINLA